MPRVSKSSSTTGGLILSVRATLQPADVAHEDALGAGGAGAGLGAAAAAGAAAAGLGAAGTGAGAGVGPGVGPGVSQARIFPLSLARVQHLVLTVTFTSYISAKLHLVQDLMLGCLD